MARIAEFGANFTGFSTGPQNVLNMSRGSVMQALMDEQSTKTVSGEALNMIKREAMRVSRLLKSDDEELHAAEADVKDGKSSH